MKKVGIMGLGNMGESITRALLGAGLAAADILSFEIKPERMRTVTDTYGIGGAASPGTWRHNAATSYWRSSPRTRKPRSPRLAPSIDESRIIVSIMAGITTSSITSMLEKPAKVVRVMPNIGVAVGEGALGVTANYLLAPDELESVAALLAPLGRIVEVNEEQMDAVTALGGSGPAFFLSFLEAMIDGGVKMGLPRDKASQPCRSDHQRHRGPARKRARPPGLDEREGHFSGGYDYRRPYRPRGKGLQGHCREGAGSRPDPLRGALRIMDNEYAGKRQHMVRTLMEQGIRDQRVLDAFRKVPRHLFLDEALWPQAYDDHPLPIGEKQTISQPYIVALMTEALQLKKTDKVLEIGTGSGYQAAILAELADRVFTIERVPALAKRARRTLDLLRYTNIVTRIGDGTQGFREESPFDAIIVTAAAPEAPDPLLKQLEIGGRLIIPIGDEQLQDLMLYVKDEEDRYHEENYGGCRFVKLIGEYGWTA